LTLSLLGSATSEKTEPQWTFARPSREERMKQCQAEPQSVCYAAPKLMSSKFNAFYGWNVGRGHPSLARPLPGYDKLLNGLDQCAWFHDRGAWRWNPRTHVCEHEFMCANSVGLLRCMEAYEPESPDEKEAKAKLMHSTMRLLELCVRKLYKQYGVGFVRDERGSQWLSAQAVRELADSMRRCAPTMEVVGFEVLTKHLKK
jgi:hypothetical protein